MAGNLVIPNTFATASGNVPAAQLDANWAATRQYVNDREIAAGTIGARPAASITGRLFFATDTAQLFMDTGSAWIQIGAPSGEGVWAIRRAIGFNNVATPLTKYDVACDAVQLRNPITGQIEAFMNPGTRTADLLVAGPAVNGRDQAAVFSANSDVHLYYVTDGTTLGTTWSIAPPTIGPALPGGYTAWGYFGVYRLNASTQLIPTRTMGSWVYPMAGQNVLTSGPATVATAVSVATVVPASALSYTINDFGWSVTTDGAGALVADLEIHIVSGTLFAYIARPAQSGMPVSSPQRTMNGGHVKVPNIGQQFFYKWTITNGSAPSANLTVTSYQVGNGGE